MPDFQKVGTVRVLYTRVYGLTDRTEAVVEPGAYPLYSDGLSYFWMMDGVLNLGGMFAHGDGLFTIGHDWRSNFKVRFPSKVFGRDEWEELLTDSQSQPGIGQRLEIIINEKENV